jgi:hypothetical protein
MSRCLKILISFIFLATGCFGQKNKTHLVSSNPPYPIEVKIKKGDQMQVRFFGKLTFHDCRIDSSTMGEVYIDLKKGGQRLSFEGGAKNYIQTQFDKLIITTPDQRSLHVVLKDIAYIHGISQAGWLEAAMISSSEKITSNLHYNADLYISGNGEIKYIGNIDTIFTAMRWLPDNVGKLTERMMKLTVMEAERNALSPQKLITEDELAAITSGAILPPILKEAKYKKGIYYSFGQFLNNEPIAMELMVEPQPGSVKLRYKESADTTKDSAWGFSDGDSIYMHLDSAYYRLNRVGNVFMVTAPETIEIVNTFATKATIKAMNVAGLFFIYDNPFKIFSLLGLTEKLPARKPYLRRYQLNIINGTLR